MRFIIWTHVAAVAVCILGSGCNGANVAATDSLAQANAAALAASMTAARATMFNPRKTLLLDGQWDFQREGESVWRTATVPGCWETDFPDLRNYTGTAVYRKTVTIPADWRGHPWIVFGAVDYAAQVVVNDRYAGFHEGGYTPFAFDLSDIVHPGDQATITLTVQDSGPSGSVKGYPFAEIPHGKQSWYGNVSGPWQSIRLEERAATFVQSLKVTPDLADSSAKVEVTLSQTPPGASGELMLSINPPNSTVPVAQVQEALSSAIQYVVNVPIQDVQLWSPATPNLYTINVSVAVDGDPVVDQYADRFGMRSIEVRDGKILLNGQPIFLAGALDQAFYPGTLYTPPSEDYLRTEFANAKRLGFNLLRCHLKLPDPMYLRLADEMGLLVWYELPNVDSLTPKSRARLADTLRDITDRDYNHPSLVIISLMNESWGIDLKNPDQRKWLISAYDYAKKLNPTRLVVDNSACAGNFHMKTDIEDFHTYFSVPDHAKQFADWVRGFSARPDWAFSPYEDAVRTGQEPLVVSEFGNWGLPSIPALRDCYDGQLPWWFKTGDGPARPDGAEDRFASYGLANVYGDYGRFARATQESQLLAFKWEIEEIRKYPQIVGYVWTELTDVNWESNGLMDFCRNVKSSGRVGQFVQQARCVFTRVQSHNIRSGGTAVAEVYISNFGAAVAPGSRIEWQLDGFPAIHGVAQISDGVAAGDARKLPDTITIPIPTFTAPRTGKILLRWMADQTLLASNYENLYMYPQDTMRFPLSLYVDNSISGSPGLQEWLTQHGGKITFGTLGADIALTAKLTPALLAWAKQGGRVIVLAQDTTALGNTDGGLRIVPRSEAGRWGDWCSSFVWFRQSPAFSGVPARSQMMGWGFEKVIPSFVIDGVDEAGAWGDVESGIFVGWVNDGAALTMRAGAAPERILITTYPLAQAAGSDALANRLLENLIQEISGDAFPVSQPVKLSAAP